MFRVIKEDTKTIRLKRVNKEEPNLVEEFFNIIICLTSITKDIIRPGSMLDEEKIEEINIYKEKIIKAIEMITDILNRDKEEVYTESKKKLEEELKQAEYVEYDVIPLLRFREIQENLNLVIEGYFDIGENLTYEKTREIATDLTRIQNAIDNITTTISNELEGQLIYNNKGLEEGKIKSLKEGKRVNGSRDNGRKTYRK